MVCPPTGHGIYARALGIEYLRRFDNVAIQYTRTGSGELARALLADGVDVYAFDGPAAWRPSDWRRTLPDILSWARAVGATGILPDPEDAWRGARAEQMSQLGRALREAAAELPVCITAFPLLPHRQALAAETKGYVSASPQLYAKGHPASALKAWFDHWEDLWGAGAVVPSVSIGSGIRDADPVAFGSAAGFHAYLESVPAAPGWWAWPTGSVPESRTRVYLDADPAKGKGLLFRAGCLVPSTTGEVLVATVVAAIVVLLVVAWWRA